MIKKLIFVIFLATPFLFAALWTVAPALRALYSCYNLRISNKEVAAAKDGSNLELRRKVQKFFLDQQVYIPFEDIFLDSDVGESEKKRFDSMISKTCGKGSMFIWVPFKFRLPIIGDRIIEWCFTPKPIG